MKLERYYPHLISLTLLVLGAAFRSPAMAYASVLALSLVLGREVYEKAQEAKAAVVVKQPVLDEMKRAVQDLNARVTTIEYNTKVRGF